MTGIEILSSEVVHNGIVSQYWMTIGLMAVVPVVLLGLVAVVDKFPAFYIICFSLAIVCAVLIVLGLTPSKDSVKYVEHKMTISEDVALLEFIEKYENVRQDGDIYIVREKK